MELKVYEAEEDKAEKPVFLRLKKGVNGRIYLQVVDIEGKLVSAGNILNIGKEGILLCTAFNAELGFNTEDDHIKVLDD